MNDRNPFATLPGPLRGIYILLILLIYVLPVILGVRAAKAKGRSPHWMWFGLNPITGWIAFLCLKYVASPIVKLRAGGQTVAGPAEATGAAPSARASDAAPQPAASRELPRPGSFSYVSGLVHEILEHVAIIFGDRSQEERIEQLVSLGPEVIPEIRAAIWSVLRSAESSSTFENAGLLCEAIGKIGGPTAFDALARFALQESRSSEYSLVRKGAVRGLAHLRDPRAAAVLAEVSQRYGFDSLVFDAHRAVGLEMPQPPRPASIPAWVEDAQTWDRIAEAFISSQVATKAPDFKGFAEMVAPYDGKRRHGAWHSVAFAFLKSGDRRTASQCFVEALLQDTDPDLSSTAWRKIELPQEGPELSDLRGRLAVAAERLSGSRELARELRELLGPPGSGGSVKEGGAQ